MTNARPSTPPPSNEPVRAYAPGSDARAALQQRLRELRGQRVDVPAIIGGEAVFTGATTEMVVPHEHSHVLGEFHHAGADEVAQAIDAAQAAKGEWAAMDFADRAAIFLRAADLLAGPWRDTLNAATMLGQSKNAHQAEIDAACELIDFFRFNVHYAEQLYAEQPNSPGAAWNQMQYRPLEGFVLAVTPFNFTSIQGNLPTAPALMGNTVLWKPSERATYAAYFLYKLLEEAGLPDGVINFLPAENGADVGDPALASEHFAGLHFTGSAGTFNHLWSSIGERLPTYRTYPTIVGETGGKDFIVAHASADVDAVATAIVRGSFEYQGQKCSASSRLYMPASIWPEIRAEVAAQLDTITTGPPEDFTNFVNAVIDQRAFDEITAYIDAAAASDDAEIIMGGAYDDSDGYFIEPTVIQAHDPHYATMEEEIFGPVTTVYVYPDDDFAGTLDLVDETSPYALTGAIFARDRAVIRQAMDRLEQAAGNFYINDKPTGAVVGQQPFGGARRSGTNDKAGSWLNLVRWVSPRAIKETFTPATHYSYPWNAPDAA
ncbi:L-glutamate gamma-semialdehyde dehydrogenase [Salisaeta longa]|uniref:L-glutamate gamma-semialdehyde dehydrogenase n=1 Tax=Salisaeta longa TaxID=503170 RepID=UPI0003B56D39|nr:L-glutamate gamma-semialdehyde dehydrogenase [Salisaeta longa]